MTSLTSVRHIERQLAVVMVHSCCVVGCSNRQGRDRGRSFYRIPKIIDGQGAKTKDLSIKRRSAWLASLNRKDWKPGNGARVCSDHFISGKLATLFDQANPDWVPTLKMGYVQCEVSGSAVVDRYERAKRRREAADAMLVLHGSQNYDDSTNGDCPQIDQEMATEVLGVACQTDESADTVKRLQEENESQRCEILELKSRTNVFSPELLEKSPDMLKFYTGILDWTIFTALLNLVAPALPSMPRSKLSSFDMLLMFLIKIRLNLFDDDIGYRYSVHRTTVSRNFHKVLDVMAAKTSNLIKWPDRATLQETMPSSFRRFFKKCCVIIDCSEVFIERPSDLLARAQVWSNYKHHSTIKFLIGITPQGTISYLSCGAGGRMSDKKNCGTIKSFRLFTSWRCYYC